MDSNRVLIITQSALFLAIIVVQEFTLSFIPGLQLTSLLITLYFYLYGTKKTLLFLIPYVFLDNLLMGSFNLFFTPTMLIGWIILVLLLKIYKTKNIFALGVVVGIHSFMYGWCFAITSSLVYETDLKYYLLMDVPFEILMFANGFLTIIVFFPLLRNAAKGLSIYYKQNSDVVD